VSRIYWVFHAVITWGASLLAVVIGYVLHHLGAVPMWPYVTLAVLIVGSGEYLRRSRSTTKQQRDLASQ